jgi:DNA-binding SARP family transcriptional activator
MAKFEVAGETERAIETGTRILGLEPLHETVARKLMRLYGRSGRRGAAIGVYRSLAAALRAGGRDAASVAIWCSADIRSMPFISRG